MLVRRSSQIDKGFFFVSLKKLVFFFFLKDENSREEGYSRKIEGLTAVVKSLMDVEGRNQGRLICLKKKGPFSLTTGKIQDGTCRKFGGCLA